MFAAAGITDEHVMLAYKLRTVGELRAKGTLR